MNRAASGTDRVPVSIVAGYLGAGKTTLINRLLAGDHGRRLAVLVNDFGELNIDVDLIASHDGETISLANGCVCCSIADALGDGLDQVLALEPRPDQIIIEASGVADPGKIAAYGQGWPGCRLDAVVVLADAETIRARAADQYVGELVLRQLRGGDLVLLTKCDLVADHRLPAIVDWVRSVGDKPVIESRRESAGDDSWVELLVGTTGRADPLDTDGTGTAIGREPHPAAGQGWADAGRLFESTVLRPSGPLDRHSLEAALARWPDTIVRVKGRAIIVEEEAGPTGVHLVQRVGRRWTIEPIPAVGSAPGRPGSGDGGNALVIVANRGTLDRAALLTDLAGGAATGDPAGTP